MTVIELASYRQTARARSLGDVAPAIADIVEVLSKSGGALHRSDVIKRIAERRGVRPGPARQQLEIDVLAAFDRYIAFAATRKQPPLLYLPFGPGSYRWSLTEAGSKLLRRVHQRQSQSAGR